VTAAAWAWCGWRRAAAAANCEEGVGEFTRDKRRWAGVGFSGRKHETVFFYLIRTENMKRF
jgi:hypothetical protein